MGAWECTSEGLTPGPHPCSKRITFQHTFQLEQSEPKTKKATKPKPRKPKPKDPRKPRVPTKTVEERIKSRQEYERARTQNPERKEAARVQARKVLRERKEKGQCRGCSNPPIPGQTRCEACRDKHRVSRQKYDAKRRKEAKKTASTEAPGDQ